MNLNQASLSLKSPRLSLADSVYETLLEAILSGQLRKGTELNAVTLAQQLDVSRTPVQEAIRRLEADGLAVNPVGQQSASPRLHPDDIREVYSMRLLLESEAAALACRQIAPAALESLRGLVGWPKQSKRPAGNRGPSITTCDFMRR